ncbi:MAG: hypothetical protein ACRD2G_12825 [Terriglobia bacterium]
MLPHLIKFGEKFIVFFDVAHLPVGRTVLLQCPIRRRGEHKLDAARLEPRHLSRIAKGQSVGGRHPLDRRFYEPNQLLIFCDSRNVRLRVRERIHLRREQVEKLSGNASLVACRILPVGCCGDAIHSTVILAHMNDQVGVQVLISKR